MSNHSTNKRKKISTFAIVLLLVMSLVAAGFMLMMIIVDAFPIGMTMTFIIVMFAMIAAAWLLFRSRKKWVRIVGVVLAILYIGLYGVGIYYLGSTFSTFARISVADEESLVSPSGVDVTKDSFNLYITGIDMWNNEKGYDLERSDVNMIMTVSPKSREILLTSIPRDTYVPLYSNGAYDKLTHTGVYGVDETINTVNQWLGIDMNYYIKVNFTSVVKIIYAIGGIDVESPKAFKSSISKYKYEKGMNHLDGREALFFARERKAFKGEDALRVENQQKVVKAMLDKLFTSSTLLTKYGHLLEIAADDMETNMSSQEMRALVKMQLADMGAWTIDTQKLKGRYRMDYVASLTQDEQFLVYKPYKKSFNKMKSAIEEHMNPSETKIAAAIARRQTGSILGFIRKIFKK